MRIVILSIIVLLSCNNDSEQTSATNNNLKKTGFIERLDPALDTIIMKGAEPEIIAEGFEWSEGPLWVKSHNMLLWSDVPRDTIYKWTEEKGREVYLTPSGYTDTIPRGGEMGSNGLLLDKNGQLVLCQCGNRQMARMDAPLDQPAPKYISLANSYQGKKFNSPNDATFNSKGDLFFTDPPYGLEKHMKDPKKEIAFQGVFRITTTGEVKLISDTITRPNGIAFLPGERTLLVANSDPQKPNWYAFDINEKDSITGSRIFLSAAGQDKSLKGLPDGMKISNTGIVFASGPGGVWIFDKNAKLLGKIRLTESASNVALSDDEKTIYITNDMYIVRLKMRK